MSGCWRSAPTSSNASWTPCPRSTSGFARRSPGAHQRWTGRPAPRLARGDLRDPIGDAVAQGWQADRPRAEDGVVEGLDLELRAEPLPRVRAKGQDLELPDLVGERLARPDDVAVDLVDDVVVAEGRVAAEEVDRLLAGPA